MKESWKAVNELLNKRSKSSNIKCLKEAGTETVHKKGISDVVVVVTLFYIDLFLQKCCFSSQLYTYVQAN